MFSLYVAAEDEPSHLSLKETAVLAGVSEKVIRHSLEFLQPHRRASKRTRHSFDLPEVFYFSLLSSLRFDLRRSDQRDLYVLLTSRKTAYGPWRCNADLLVLTGIVGAVFETKELVRRVADRCRLYRQGGRRVVSNPDVLGGEQVFEGTRISVRHVGQLLKKGVPEAELLEDFPKLSKEDLEFARIFVALGRPPGRPKKLKFVRAHR